MDNLYARSKWNNDSGSIDTKNITTTGMEWSVGGGKELKEAVVVAVINILHGLAYFNFPKGSGRESV